MAVQIQNKQPRPLSIINEIILDDCFGSDFQDHSSNTTKDNESPEIFTRQRNIRRKAVAPLQHPMVALTQQNESEAACGNQTSLQGSSTEVNSESTCNVSHNEIHIAADDKLEDYGNSSHTVNSTHDKEQHQTKRSHTLECSTRNECKYGPKTLTTLHGSYLNDAKDGTREFFVTEKCSSSSNISKNSASYFRIDADIRRDRQTLQNDASKLSSYKEHLNGKGRLALEDNVNTPEPDNVKYAKSKSMPTEMGKIDQDQSVETERTIEKESIDTEQQAWKNRVRKSSSFTKSSIKSRPLRRSMGSFDFKNSPSLARYGQRVAKGEESTSIQSIGANKVQFYLSSDLQAGQEDEFNRDCCDHEHILKKYENEHPWLSASMSSLRRKNSLHDPSKDKEISINVGTSGITSLLSNATNQADYSSSGVVQIDNSKQSHSGIQSDLPSIRRISTVDQSDFFLLKATATRLNLATRRPSTTAWKTQYLDNHSSHKHWDLPPDSNERKADENDNVVPTKNNLLTEEVKKRISQSLSLLRQELISIRHQDQNLARQFLNIRHSMNKLRLAVECKGHMKLLDEAEEDVDDLRELSRLVDIPHELLSPLASLQHLGVTRMNLTSRRFSTC